MKYIRNIILLGVLAFSQLIYSQDFHEFYIEVTENNYVPVYDKSTKKYLIHKDLKDSQAINNILNEK